MIRYRGQYPPAIGRRRIGLLGGSFNPAHSGHRHLSLEALKRLGLDEVWWLVSPQNPLKPVEGMAPLAARMLEADAFARHPRIRVSAIEVDLGTQFTADTLAALSARYPKSRFVWLMGADNLIQMNRWDRWISIFQAVPVAVFARPTYALRALSSPAARRFAKHRLMSRSARRLAGQQTPAWVYLPMPLNAISATDIRAARAGTRSRPVDENTRV